MAAPSTIPFAPAPDYQVLWRCSNYADLQGIGGIKASARWHTAGKPIVYCALQPSAAVLEVLVHFDVLPDTYKLLRIDVPNDITRRAVKLASLPADGASDLTATRAIGDEWLINSNSALLAVPSVVVPVTWNVLLNPRHPDAARVSISHVEQFPFDPRLR